jgi:transposase
MQKGCLMPLLTDGQFRRISHLLPGRLSTVGVTAKNNRQFLEGVFYVIREGGRWRSLPKEFGPWERCYRRYNRWCDKGVFEKIFQILSADADFEYIMLDSTIVRAHQHSAGAKGGNNYKHLAKALGVFAQKSTPPVMVLEIQSAFFLPKENVAILRKHSLC